MVLTVPGRKTGASSRSTPMTPFDHDGGLYTVAGYPGLGLGGQCPCRRHRDPDPGPTVPTGQDRRTRRRTSHVRCCARSRSKCRSASASPSAAASSIDGTPDEFEALAGRLTVFRFDPA